MLPVSSLRARCRCKTNEREPAAEDDADASGVGVSPCSWVDAGVGCLFGLSLTEIVVPNRE